MGNSIRVVSSEAFEVFPSTVESFKFLLSWSVFVDFMCTCNYMTSSVYWKYIFSSFILAAKRIHEFRHSLIPIKLTTCISILYKNVSCKIYWSQVWNNMNNMQYFELIHFQIYFMVLKYHKQHPLWPVPIQIRIASWEFLALLAYNLPPWRWKYLFLSG